MLLNLLTLIMFDNPCPHKQPQDQPCQDYLFEASLTSPPKTLCPSPFGKVKPEV